MKNILVVDDNKFILDALSARLSVFLKSCKVLTASNGVRGTDILRSTHIDLILTDLDIPIVDGYRFIESARTDYPAIPVCVMTGECAPHVKERLMKMGICRHIEKPFQFEDLARLISEELNLTPHASLQAEGGHA